MFALLLALAGVFTVSKVVAAQTPTGGPSVVGNVPPKGYSVSCPTELTPGNWAEWATPCDVQTYSGPPPPEPWGGQGCPGLDADGKQSNICRILPDGTPLYEYAIDGIPYSERQPGVVQTYFAGVPLDFPPLLDTGAVGWVSGTTGNPIWQKGVAATDISKSPAPFAWHKPTKNSAGFLDPSSGHVYPSKWVVDKDHWAGGYLSSPEIPLHYSPARGVPYKRNHFRIGDALNFVNSIKKFACSSLSTGLTVSSGILSSDVATGLVPGGKTAVDAAHKVAKGFYTSICSE